MCSNCGKEITLDDFLNNNTAFGVHADCYIEKLNSQGLKLCVKCGVVINEESLLIDGEYFHRQCRKSSEFCYICDQFMHSGESIITICIGVNKWHNAHDHCLRSVDNNIVCQCGKGFLIKCADCQNMSDRCYDCCGEYDHHFSEWGKYYCDNCD